LWHTAKGSYYLGPEQLLYPGRLQGYDLGCDTPVPSVQEMQKVKGLSRRAIVVKRT
jgi:hypothetical protein